MLSVAIEGRKNREKERKEREKLTCIAQAVEYVSA